MTSRTLIVAQRLLDQHSELSDDIAALAFKEPPRSNADRANEARLLMKTMHLMTGVDLYETDEDEEAGIVSDSVVGDALAHIMHLCRHCSIDFDMMLRVARGHFADELAEEEETTPWPFSSA